MMKEYDHQDISWVKYFLYKYTATVLEKKLKVKKSILVGWKQGMCQILFWKNSTKVKNL